MRRQALILALAAAFTVAACTPPQQAVTLASVEIALTAAENAGLAYRTSAVADPAVVVKILAADTIAYNAVKTARSGGSVAAADAAVLALVALIPVTK